MAGKTRSFFLSLAIITVMVFGAVSPAVAYADDRKPPDTPPAEASNGGASATSDDAEAAATQAAAAPTSAPAEATTAPSGTTNEATAAPTSAPTEATAAPSSAPAEVTAEVTSTPAPTTTEATSTPDEAPTQAGSEGNTSSNGDVTAPPATEEAAPAATASTPAPASTVLDQVPANTTVTVLDAQGQSQPLASQDAANAVATGDPIWCPQGQAPTPGTNGCTNSFNSFNALLTFLSGNANYQGAGTIYIQAGVYITGGTNDFNSPNYDLSNIRNSALTITGGWNTTTGTVDPTSTSTFRVPFLIGTSTNPWGGSIAINNLSIDKSDGTSLVIYTQGDITLTNVNITNAHNNGAGAELNAGGNVNINNSTFIRNKRAGAIIKAAGNVAIADSTFSNFTSHRLQITGLDITSGGGVSLANVEASNNRQVGANINAGGQVTIAGSFFSGNKAFVGKGPSSGFTGYGLQVVTPDAINLSSVTASDNFLWGGSLQAGGDVNITDSIFNANTTASPHFIDDTGLLVKSGGSVSLNNTQANDNRLIGATINATGDVSITNSTFTNNKGVTLAANKTPVFHGYGLQVVTTGNIFLGQVNASNNTLFGAHLEGGQVTIFNSNFDNMTSGSATDQTGRGLEIISAGDVILSNVSVSNNQTFGANIQSGGLVLLDTITASSNGADGVDVQGNCTPVIVNAGTYSNNGGYGLSVNGASLDQSNSPVFSNNAAGDIFQNTGSCVFPSSHTAGGTGNVINAGTGLTTPNPVQAASQYNFVQAASQQSTHLFNGAGFPGKEGFFPITGMKSKGPTLNGFLVNLGSANENSLGTFVGQYAYIYSNSVLHIVALLPLSGSLAMAGS